GGEIGTHFATIPFGILAVGLKVGAARIGISDRDRTGNWIAGGTGADGGVGVHYAFPCFGLMRIDPSISGVGGILDDGGPAFGGAWARAELEIFIEIVSWTSVQVTGGLDLRSYSLRRSDPNDARSFDGRVFRGGVGLAFFLPK